MIQKNTINLNGNGFIVKRLDTEFAKEFRMYANYSGIEGYSWPIDKYSEGIESDEIKYLVDYAWDNIESYQDNNDFVAVCADIDFINRYVVACKEMGYEIEILFCESERGTPKCNVNLNDKSMYEFIGFDYAYPDPDYYSCIYQEVQSVEGMKHIRLNKNGLFETVEEVINFINLREALKMCTPKITFELGEFIVYRLWRFIGEDSISGIIGVV